MFVHPTRTHSSPLMAQSARSIARFAAAALLISLTTGPLLAQRSLTLQGTRGETLGEADLARGATVIVVWASWSPRGQDVVERVHQIQARWGGRSRVVTVNFQESREEIDRFLAGKGLRTPVFLDEDGAFSKKHAVTTLPGLIVFKDGQVAYRGRLPDNPDQVLAEILGG